MRVHYHLPDVGFFGGVKVVFQQAELLHEMGHEVAVVSPSAPPDWYSLRAPYLQERDASKLPEADVNVATFWTTIDPVLKLPGKAVHLCQGFEFLQGHNRDQHPDIIRAYGRPMPCLAVSSHLASLVQSRFHRASRVVPQMLGLGFQPQKRLGPKPPFRIGMVALFEADLKGVATGLRAIKILQAEGLECRVIRVSQWPLCKAEEQLLSPDEFHHRLPPEQMPDLYRTLDLVLTPSWEAEGFGLPALEGMACGVPVVASDVSCYRGFARDAAPLLAPLEPELWADAMRKILTEPGLWEKRRELGIRVATRFRQVGLALEDAFQWALTQDRAN